QANYHGQIWGGNVFVSSFQRGTPATFPIGVGAVIAGWDQGIVGKNVGSRLLISIPPEKGYGPNGQPAAGIGGTDTLVFVVDLVGVR
ncbi:MAG: FKBP-type peptidyl-prolyl cis-trans isomerase, partial [Ancrocorticia populi]|uniref:FKBP-type peptidyl-prolyl cis-trans isomerase n=1 Tax=Ancrocorticia populi TaxID=2175228 RepID=UPI003F8DB866